MLILKMYLTFFLATKLAEILQKHSGCQIKPAKNDLNLTFILETIDYFCKISSSLEARNKVKYSFKISMDRALGEKKN